MGFGSCKETRPSPPEIWAFHHSHEPRAINPWLRAKKLFLAELRPQRCLSCRLIWLQGLSRRGPGRLGYNVVSLLSEAFTQQRSPIQWSSDLQGLFLGTYTKTTQLECICLATGSRRWDCCMGVPSPASHLSPQSTCIHKRLQTC